LKHIFIINPSAGKRDHSTQTAAMISSFAEEKRLDFHLMVTRYPRHAAELARNMADVYLGMPLRFYACGGDGTLNEVAQGVRGMQGVSVSQIPLGTGNDLVKAFGGAQGFLSLDQMIRGDAVEVDYIEASCGIALNVFSVGVDARIANGIEKYKHLPLMKGQGPYLLSTIEQLLRGLGRPYRVTVDGKRYDGRYSLILAANGKYYGGGFCPVPDADLQDGLLDVLLVKEVSRLTAAAVIGAYKKGEYARLPEYITHIRAKELTVEQADCHDIEVNMDGEIVFTDRISAHVVPRGLSFVVPVKARRLIRV